MEGHRPLLDRPRQLPEGPAGEPGALGEPGSGGAGCRCRGGDRGAQGAEVPVAGHCRVPAHDGELHDEVGRDPGAVEVVGGDGDRHEVGELPSPGAGGERRSEHLGQPALVRGEAGEDLGGDVGGGHEVAALGLGQGADERGDELVAQAGHLPGEGVGIGGLEGVGGDLDGHPVGRRAGVVGVAQPGGGAVGQGPFEREVGGGPGGQLGGVVAQQRLDRDVEELGLVLPDRLPPGVEVGAGYHGLRQAGVVEVEEHLVLGEQASVADPGGELLGLGDRGGVAAEEGVALPPFAVDERVADEQLAGHDRIDLPVAHPLVAAQGHPVERHRLVGHRRTAALRPVGFAVPAQRERSGGLDDPFGFDDGDGARPQPRGLDELGGHDDFRP